LIIIFFDEYFWVSEAFLAFWLLVSLEYREGKNEIKQKPKNLLLFGMIFMIFVCSNIYHFNSLHPKSWAKNTNTLYDYGFWYPEMDSQGNIFSWTKEKAGIYLFLNKTGRSREIKLVCGAPIQKLEAGKQIIDIYWRGRLYKTYAFEENRELRFYIEDRIHREGFLEFRIEPAFNLRKMGLSEETRDLGIQFFYPE
jgi:hypothetical protein